MTVSDLPQGTATDVSALDFDQGVEGITDLLNDSDVNPGENAVVNEAAETETEAEGDKPKAEDEDEALVIEDDPDSEDEADGPGEIKGGQFAPDSAKVTLEDGTVISIADLKRNNLFQRDYTAKTTAFKAEMEAERAARQQEAQALAQQRDFVLSVAERYLPPRPTQDMIDSDLVGYWKAKEAWEEIGHLQALQQQDLQQKAHEEQIRHQQTVRYEVEQLREKLPHLREQGKMEQFKTEVFEALAPYGFSPDEVGSVVDHRMLLVAKDIVRLQKALKKAPQVKEQVQQKPKLISGGKRMDPKARTSLEAKGRAEQLRKSGSMDAGIAALMDLDL